MLMLIDGTNCLFRAHYALPQFTSSGGEPSGAIVGMVELLRKLRIAYRPKYIGVVFDHFAPTFREALYANYKAQRPPAPSELIAQIKPLMTIIQSLGLSVLCVPGVEADDVIGTLATQAAADGVATLIFSNDKDFSQLVTEQITVVDPINRQRLDPAGVTAKFGVPPPRIVDYLTLVGDTCDNVPGVPGCGPKTAVKWLAAYGDLAGVIAHAGDINGRVGDNLRQVLDCLPLMQQLVTIRCDVALDVTPRELAPSAANTNTLHYWYTRLESTRLLATLPPPRLI